MDPGPHHAEVARLREAAATAAPRLHALGMSPDAVVIALLADGEGSPRHRLSALLDGDDAALWEGVAAIRAAREARTRSLGKRVRQELDGALLQGWMQHAADIAGAEAAQVAGASPRLAMAARAAAFAGSKAAAADVRALVSDLDQCPECALAFREAGRLVAFVTDRPAHGARFLGHAVGLDPDDWRAWLHLADVQARALGDVEAALGTLSTAVERLPEVPELWAARGKLQEAADAPVWAAEAAWRQATRLAPERAWPRVGLAGVQADLKADTAAAEATLRDAIAADPEDAEAWHDLGVILSRAPDRRPEAEAALQRACALVPRSRAVWRTLAALLVHTPGRRDDAATALRRALSIDPSQADCWHDLALTMLEPPASARAAERALRTAVRVDPRRADTWRLLGRVLHEHQGAADAAADCFRTARDLAPHDPTHANELAWLHVVEGTVGAEALDAARAAVIEHPEEPNFRHTLGCVLLALGDREGAAREAAACRERATAEFLDEAGHELEDLEARLRKE